MNVLVACEFSGTVREEFRKRGHNAFSCDLLPTDRPGNHFIEDVLKVIDWGCWDLMIAHPPCTYLTNSGVRWLHSDPIRWIDMRLGAYFFKKLLNAPIPKKAVENPIMHGYAVEIVGRKHDQLIQPFHFGHAERKATCLWLEGLPPLEHTHTRPELLKQTLWRLPPTKDRWKLRSITFPGIAKAMARQWG